MLLDSRQLDEQAELRAGQGHHHASQKHDTVIEADREVTEIHPPGTAVHCRLDAAQESTDTRGELFGNERLGHVVVGARLESADHVVAVRARRHHDDGDRARPAQLAAHRESVPVREHQVEQHDVRPGVVAGLQALLAGGRFGYLESLVLQGEPENPADPGIVLNQQDASPHHTSVSRALGESHLVPPKSVTGLSCCRTARNSTLAIA